MEFPIKFYTVKSGWSIVYIILRGHRKEIVFVSPETDFVLADSADPDEMSHYVAFHLGLQRLPKYPFLGFRSSKG